MAEKTAVTFENGKVQEFGVRTKMIKDTEITDYGFKSDLYFPNGKLLTYMCDNADLFKKFAVHGADQKLGDECAGIKEVDDCVLAVESLIARLEKGDWNKERTSNGMAGTSILIQALVEHTGKDVGTIKEYLSDKTQAQKLALRTNPKIKAIVDRLEAEKAARLAEKNPKAVIDTDELLAELE